VEPITLCGLVVVVFGLWIELEAVIGQMLNAIGRVRLWGGRTAMGSLKKS